MKRKPPTPTDAEKVMNARRAAWAGAAVRVFMKQTGTDKEDVVCDLLCDLAHWCDIEGIPFLPGLRRAVDHYRYETGNIGKQITRSTLR